MTRTFSLDEIAQVAHDMLAIPGPEVWVFRGNLGAGKTTLIQHLAKALESLAEEGVTQVFKRDLGGDWIVGVVGSLQLDVLKTRIEGEYGIAVTLEQAPFETARWVECDDEAEFERFMSTNRQAMSRDRDGAPVFLARNSWELKHQMDKFKSIRFSTTRERH